MSDREQQPVEGQVYFAAEANPVETGAAGLYVRTEQLTGDAEPFAVFVIAHDRVVFTRRTPRSRLAAEWTLDYTPPAEGVERAAELSELRAERRGLVAAMRKATALAPEHSKALRTTYRQERH